jgi:peptidoglycan/LPS O-acetylase OafA/YrhL
MYLRYLNLLRAIASMLIVFFHCIHGLQWGGEYGNQEMMRLLKILSAYGTFLFVFIAGFLFQHLLYKYNYLEYLRGRLL